MEKNNNSININTNNPTISKELIRTIMHYMDKQTKHDFKHNNKLINVHVYLYKELRRWGDEADFTINKYGEILTNNLTNSTWNWDYIKSKHEAANAINYFFYDNDNISKIEIIVIEQITEEKEKSIISKYCDTIVDKIYDSAIIKWYLCLDTMDDEQIYLYICLDIVNKTVKYIWKNDYDLNKYELFTECGKF